MNVTETLEEAINRVAEAEKSIKEIIHEMGSYIHRWSQRRSRWRKIVWWASGHRMSLGTWGGGDSLRSKGFACLEDNLARAHDFREYAARRLLARAGDLK